MVNKEILIKELQSIPADYKASVVAAEISENGVPTDRLYFRNISTFNRFVSKDINRIYWDAEENDGNNLIFDLNREGIYDMVPEGLTHSTSHKATEKEAIEEFAIHRKQEAAARNFFGTFENEFHQWYLELEIIEREMLNNKNAGKNRTIFEYYFGSSKFLSDVQVATLLYILPLSNKIRGDVKLLSETLTKVLNYKIDVRCKTGKSVIKGEAMASCHLDSSALGVNSILSEAYTTCVFYYDIMVHNIPWNQYKHFIKDGIHSNVLSFMLPYFFPMDADVNIVLLCEPNSAFTLSAVSQESFLGFNSLI